MIRITAGEDHEPAVRAYEYSVRSGRCVMSDARAMTKLSIHEARRLVLPVETVVDALLQFDRDNAGTLSYGTILNATIEPEPDPGVLLLVRLRGSQTIERRIFALPAIAAAVLNYCRQSRIPLPLNGTKTLEMTPEGFVLSIRTTLSVPRWHNGCEAADRKPNLWGNRAAARSVPVPGTSLTAVRSLVAHRAPAQDQRRG